MSTDDEFHIADERPLTTEERTLLEWLISIGGERAVRYASQVPRTTVVSHCSCGCPTIDLAVDGKTASGISELTVDADGMSPEGFPVGVVLHCREGLLSELEVYTTLDVEGRFSLPKPEALR
jgi:hypothetical protein